MSRTMDQIVGKYLNISRAKHCQCDARTLADTTAQFIGPDLTEKLTKAGDLPQTLAISSTTTISSTCGLEEWCELQDPLKFKLTSGVTILDIPELSQKDLDFEENFLKSLKIKSAADFRNHQAMLNYLPESYADHNRVLKIITTGLASTQASQDTVHPQQITTACDQADQIRFNSQIVAAYMTDLDKCPTLDTDCFKNFLDSTRLACQGDLACEQALAAAAQKKPKIDLKLKKDLDRVTEPVARRTDYHRCKCYQAAVEDALTKLNESRPFEHQVDPLIVSLDNDLLSNKCGINDRNQLCGAIVFSAEDGSIQLDWQERKSAHSRGRRLQPSPFATGQCKGPKTNYNLLNTDVQTSQSSVQSGFNTDSNAGCDGVIQYNNPSPSDTARIVNVQNNAGKWYWVATFQQRTNVQSILYIERQYTSSVSILVGDDPNFPNNPPCIGEKLTAGGWLECARLGKYLILTGTNQFQFMEVMCYSQYFVHHNALSSTLSSTRTTAVSPWFCTKSTNCQASNVIRTTLVIWPDTTTPCCIISNYQINPDPTLKMIIPAELMIECILITPSDQGTSSNQVYSWQKEAIEVSIVNSAGQEQLCGKLSEYNLYTEVPCKKVGNQIIVKKPGTGNKYLVMAGASILSNCECSQTSLNPALIFAAKPLASPTTLSTTSTGAPVSITLNKQMADTVSRVCGNGDGFTKCGLRSTLVFTDKMTGRQITFPYKGFELNSDQSNLMLNPAKAPPTNVFTVTVKLQDYPSVTFSQDITAIVEGALTVVQPLMIPNMALNATINKEAFLDLPELEASYIYFVTSKQKFEVSVDGNQLKVFSKNETDVGTYSVNLVAKSSSKNVTLKVKVILALPTSIDTETQTVAISEEVDTPTTTTETKEEESIIISDQETESLLETASCIEKEANIISCVLPNGYSFQIDGGSGKTFSGDSTKEASAAAPKLPKLKISKVNNWGQFYIKFSEPVDFEALNITASQSRRKAEGAGSSSERNATQLYLLSAKQLNLTIKSENTSAAVFSWHATSITSTQIMIQLEFQDPLLISTSARVLDKLIVQILPPALMFMRSATGAMTEDPLITVSRNLPPQVIPGRTIDIVEEVTKILSDVGKSSVGSNIVVQTLLSGSMAQMWTMVNAQQIFMIQQQLNLKNPGNVIMVMTKLSEISSFEGVLPTEDILEGIFDFTPTDSPGMGFECMGVKNASVTLYLGITFIIMILIGLLYLVYSLAYACRLYVRVMSMIEQQLKPRLCLGLFYLFLQENYLDWAVGSALRLEQPKFVTPSDYFDFGLSCAGILITLIFPCYCFFFLKKNVNNLDNKDFKSNHGALYQGFTTDSPVKRSASLKMAVWFLLRRLLTAVNLVFLRHQTIWIQLTLNMWLSLIDVCVKIHLSPYKSKLGGFMEKFNDLFVLTCAYFPYLFTDLTPSPEDKYFIGWFYDGTVGTMIAANLIVIVKTTFHGIVNKIREMILNYKLKKVIEARNVEKEAKMKKLLQSGTVEGAISVKFKNGLRDIHVVSLDYFLEIKREQRQINKDASLAQRLAGEMDEELSEIAEVDEESQQSISAVRNDLEAQIREESQVQQQPQPQVAEKTKEAEPKKENKVPSFNQFQQPNRSQNLSFEQQIQQTDKKLVRIRESIKKVQECRIQLDAILSKRGESRKKKFIPNC